MEQVGNTFYRSLVQSFIQTLHQQKIFSFFLVFITIVGALKANQFVFYHFDTSPAVILMPTGIAIAAVYLWGYRMWLPVAVAWACALLTSPASLPLFGVGVGTIAYTLQVLVGGYLLKKFDFLGTLGRTRCALILVGVALVVPTIAPTITTTLGWLFGALTDSAWETWSRAWAGGVLSVLVFTPLITTWYRENRPKTKTQLVESVVAVLSLVAMVYFTFWTKLPQVNVFLILYLLFGSLFWIGLRMRPRITATAIFLIAALGMAGSIIAQPSTSIGIGAQLFADELFIILIAPIFYLLAALVEERKASTAAALERANELEEANKKLSREDQVKNEFLATLAHELRNPLAPVVSSLELIKMKAQELGQPDILELAEVAATHNATLIQLIDDLLEVSRISQNKLKLKMERVSLAQVAAQAARTVETLYKSRHHSLLIELPQEEVTIVADPLRLEQILVNLLNNAAKYTPDGGEVELRITHAPGDGLHIRVKDSGIGIEPSMFEKIFEPFVQSAVGGSGLGIGLSLTKRLVELHGGNIMVESEGMGKGSEFIVHLPHAEANEQTITRRPRRGATLHDGQRSNRALSILLVDDNQAAADGLAKLLEYKGHAVRVAYSGPDALEMVRKEVPDVVLLDIGLPGMDGYEVARRMREARLDDALILVALTGFGQDEDKAKALAAGFNFHLTKPVGVGDVEAILATEEVQNAAQLF